MSKRQCYMHDGVLIPGCWGAVHHGRQGCYCKRVPSYNTAEFDRRLRAVERQLVRIKEGRR